MACSCHEIGTKVECTPLRLGRIFSVSRPGGGLFGRPTTRESLGRFLIVGVFSAVLIPRRERPAHAGVTRSHVGTAEGGCPHVVCQTTFCERWRFALAANSILINNRFFRSEPALKFSRRALAYPRTSGALASTFAPNLALYTTHAWVMMCRHARLADAVDESSQRGGTRPRFRVAWVAVCLAGRRA